jgi:hypothetical protein
MVSATRTHADHPGARAANGRPGDTGGNHVDAVCGTGGVRQGSSCISCARRKGGGCGDVRTTVRPASA